MVQPMEGIRILDVCDHTFVPAASAVLAGWGADDERMPSQPGPAFGDSIGAMTIAGGIATALFHRESAIVPLSFAP